jgi:hypothetical protein
MNRETGDKIRIAGYAAPEAFGMKDEEGNFVDDVSKFQYSPFEPAHRQSMVDYINSGFNISRDTGETNRNRRVADLVNPIGMDVTSVMLADAMADPSPYVQKFNDGTAHGDWVRGQFKLMEDGMDALPAWRQAEILVKQATGPRVGPIPLSGVFVGNTPVDRALEKQDPNDLGNALEYWWLTKRISWNGFSATLGDEEAKKNLDRLATEFNNPGFTIDIQQIEGVDSLWDWFTNNLIVQGPDYAVLAGGPALGAAIGSPLGPVGAAAGGFIGFLLSSGYDYIQSVGQVGSEMYYENGEIDSGTALAVGGAIHLLNHFGAKGLMRPDEVFTDAGKAKLIKHVADQTGKDGKKIGIVEAAKIVEDGKRNVMKEFAKDLRLSTGDMLTKRRVALNMANRLLKQGTQESVTEAGQEALQYLAVSGIPKNADEWEEFAWRIGNASAAGFAVGTTYQTPRTISDYVRAQSLRENNEYVADKDRYQTGNVIKLSQIANGKTAEDVVKEYNKPVAGETIFDRLARGETLLKRTAAKSERGEYNPTLSSIKNATRGKLLRKDGTPSLLGSTVARIFGAYNRIPGYSLYDMEQMRASEMDTNIPWLNDPEGELGIDDAEVSRLVKLYLDLDADYREDVNNGINSAKLDQRDVDLIHKMIMGYKDSKGNHVPGIGHALSTINEYYPDPTDQNVDLSYRKRPAFLFTNVTPDMATITNDPQAFVEALQTIKSPKDVVGVKQGEYISKEIATKIVESLISGIDIAESMRFLGDVGANRLLPEFYPNTSTQSIKNRIATEIKVATRAQYLGRNLEVLSNIVNAMYDDGQLATQKEADEFAADLYDQVAKHIGIYGRVRSEEQRIVQNIEETSRMLTTVAQLDAAIFAQVPEALYAFVGVNAPLNKKISTMAKNFVLNILEDFKLKEPRKERTEYERLGMDDQQELLRQEGIGVSNKWRSFFLQWFFKLNLVKSATDAIRMSRMMFSNQVIANLLEQVKPAYDPNTQKLDPSKFNRTIAEAFERLTFYGADPNELASIHYIISSYPEGKNPAEEVAILHQINATHPNLLNRFAEIQKLMKPAFIDETTVRIKPGSRQAIFDERRWGLPFLTQFMSFISYFSANIVPRLWTTYGREAKADTAYATFQLAALAIAIAYVSQYLKDLLLKGELNPGLAEYGDIQRAIDYSNVFGLAPELINRMVRNPYGFGGDFSDIMSIPALDHLSTVGGKVMEGEYGEAASKGIPFANVIEGIMDRVSPEPENKSPTIQRILGD